MIETFFRKPAVLVLTLAIVIPGVYLFMTGGAPFIPASLEPLIAAKPALHRLAIMVLSFLAFAVMVWQRWKIKIKERLVLAVLFISSALTWTAASWLRFLSFEDGFDMAIFVQSIWATTRGSFLHSSIKGGICLLGDHMSPLLAILAVPYAAFPEPALLLALQAVSAALGIFPLYSIAARHLKQKEWALAVVFAYAVYLPLRNAVRFEFHPEVLAAPFMLWAFDALERNRKITASVFLALLLSSKEGAALSTAALCVYIFLAMRDRRLFAAVWLTLSAFWFVFSIKWLIPKFAGGEYFYLSGNFLAWKDEGLAALARHVGRPASAAYLVKIFAPVAFLAFLNPLALIPALPPILQNLTARNPQVVSIFFQYTAFLTPAVFLSVVFGLKKLEPRNWAPVMLVGASILMAGAPDGYLISRSFKTARDPMLMETRDFLKSIPAEASVRTHEFLAPFLAHRKNLHIYENRNPREGGSPEAMSSDYVIVGKKWLGGDYETHFAEIEKLGYSLTDDTNGLRVYQKGKS